MKRGNTLTYLHADHLDSTVLETNTSGTATANQTYCAGVYPERAEGAASAPSAVGSPPVAPAPIVSSEYQSKTGLRRVDAIPFVSLSCALIHLPRQQRCEFFPRRHIEHRVDEGVELVEGAAL